MTEYIVDLAAHNASAAMALCDGVHEEIVRCEDCKFFDTRQCKSQWPFRLDGYCAWGERRAADDD